MAKRPTDRIKLKVWNERTTMEYDGTTVEGLGYCGWGLTQGERNTLIEKLQEQRAEVLGQVSVAHDETTLHVAVENAFDEIDAAFFSGDQFSRPECLSRAEHFTARWLREAERIRAANFFNDPEDQ